MKLKKRLRMTLDEIEKEMELLTLEEQEQARGGGKDDIIVLIDSNAAMGRGHAAILIGDDINGWRYLSVNGTQSGGPWGTNYKPDLGDKIESGTWRDVVDRVKGEYNFDKFLRIETTVQEDAIAYKAARDQASSKDYSVFGSSCIDVVQEAIKAVYKSRNENVGGDYKIIPNNYFEYLVEKGVGYKIEY